MNASGGQRGGAHSASGVGLVGGRVALLLGGDVSTMLIDRLKEAVFARDTVDAVFNVLSAAGIRNLPSFACVIRDDQGVRLLLRGSVAAIVRTFSGEERTIKGEQVSTWAEHVVRAPREVTLRSGTASTDTGMLVLLFEEKDTRKSSKRVVRPPQPQDAPWDAERSPPRRVEPRPTPTPPPPGRRTPPRPQPAPGPVRPRAEQRRSAPPAGRPGEITILPEFEVGEAPAAAPRPIGRSEKPSSPPSWTDTDGEFDFSHLLDQTIHHGVEAAAVREPTSDDPSETTFVGSGPLIGHPPSFPPMALPKLMGDHDGDTVAHPRVVSGPRPSGDRHRPSVQAVQCASGHANPPTADRCSTCDDSIRDRAIFEIERPVLGRLRFSDGLVIDLDRPVVLGRKPNHAPMPDINGEKPGVVALPDPEKSLSRQHVEVRLEEWHVFVVDRQSANGTYVDLPGEATMQLHPGEPCLITPGTRVTLADVVSFVFDAAPG